MRQQLCARIGADLAIDLAGDGLAQWASGNRQLNVHGDVVSAGVRRCGRGFDGGNHAEVGDRTTELGVDDLAQAFVDVGFDLTCVAHKSVSSFRACSTLACDAAACQREWSKSHWGGIRFFSPPVSLKADSPPHQRGLMKRLRGLF